MIEKQYVIDHPETFDSDLKRILDNHQNGSKIYLFVIAAVDPALGRMWCGDCVDAYPIVEKAIQNLPDPSILINCTVERSQYKGNPSFLYRTHPKLHLRAIPQLYKVDPLTFDLPGTLIERECCDVSLLSAFL